MSDETMEAGWRADPTGRFSHRYFDGSSWTEHVAQDGATTSDPLKAAPGAKSSKARKVRAEPQAMVSVPGTASVVALADTPKAALKRRTFGIVLLALLGVILVTLVMPWVAGSEAYSDGDPRSLTGLESSAGRGVGFLALCLGAYAWQALGRPRVRFSIAAAFAVVILLWIAILPGSSMGDKELAELGVDGPQRTSRDVSDGPVGFSVDFSSEDEDNPFANADRVDPEIGLQIATLAGLGLIVPVTVLWRDDRARRRQAGLLL